MMTGGTKQTIADALIERIESDYDTESVTYQDYLNNPNKNGRRMITCPVNTGALGTPPYELVGYGTFFLSRPAEYTGNATLPFCAEYVP